MVGGVGGGVCGEVWRRAGWIVEDGGVPDEKATRLDPGLRQRKEENR